MRGFPIVSIGNVTGTSRFESFVVVPQFEVDEYYCGKENRCKEFYEKMNPVANSLSYIKSFTIYPNNVNLTEGVRSLWDASFGFMNLADYYTIYEKLSKVRNIRVDSFYAYTIGRHFFEANDQVERKLESLYINVPNAVGLEGWFALDFFSDLTNLYINGPKVDSTGSAFLYLKRNLQNIRLNTPNFVTVGRDAFGYWNNEIPLNIYTVQGEAESIRIMEMFDIAKDNIGQHEGSNATFAAKSEAISIEDFDIRYWDIWQNTTGKDSGLH